ncbi:MAG TPA: hypothetical protein VNX25_05960 [Verrucomicrobiae bacterium]|nr:hypothetical protein [Verrucomicrobiae bacterium]
MAVKNKMWMTGSLEWFAFLGDEEVYLGSREVPYPLDEGNEWVNRFGHRFRVVDGEIVLLEKGEPPQREW